jgi:glycosyltransferase involved in cell wall biosynthesis
MQKTAFLSLTNLSGGAESVMFSLHNYLSPNSEFFFLTQKGDSNLDVDRIHFFSSSKFILRGAVKMLFYLRQLNEFDYIFSSHQFLNSYLGFLKKIGLLTYPTLIYRESTSIFLRNTGLKLLCYRISYFIGYGRQKLIITQSELMRRQLKNNISSSVCWNIKTIPNPINIDEINIKSNEYVVNEKKFIVAAGRLIPEKGFDILIKAYNQIKEKINYKRLIILGDGADKAILQNLIKELNLNNHVSLMGHVDNPMPYFKQAEVCVVSSRIEGFPNVLLQMMATNGNVVSTLCAGGIEKLNGVNICPPNNVDLLAQTLVEAIESKCDRSLLFKNELEQRSIFNYWSQIQRYLVESSSALP